MSIVLIVDLRPPWTPRAMARHLQDVDAVLSATWDEEKPRDLRVEIDMSAPGGFDATLEAIGVAAPDATPRFADDASAGLTKAVNHLDRRRPTSTGRPSPTQDEAGQHRPTVRQQMKRCGREMPTPFQFADVKHWFEVHHLDATEATLRANLAWLTEGSTSSRGSTTEPEAIFRRVQHGQYEYIVPTRRAGRHSQPVADGSVVLYAVASGDRLAKGERKTRLEQFADSKREAHRNNERWFALSPYYGLIHDHEPSTASLIMPPVPDEHGDTWAAWVAVRLENTLGDIDGVKVRIDAPEQYIDLLRPALLSRGAVVQAQVS